MMTASSAATSNKQVDLPLVTMEEYFLWEDRPGYPWSCFIPLRFSGKLQPSMLEEALRMVLPRHPLLRSKVEQRGKRFFWVEDETAMPEIQWIEGAPGGNELPSATHLDLRDEIGLRLLILCDEDDCDLVIQFHHACCDGKGIFVFIEDLLIAYAMANGQSVRLPKLDLERLKVRGKFELTIGKFIKMLPQQWIGLKGARQFLSRKPVAVIPHECANWEESPQQPYPTIIRHVFTVEQTLNLRETAKEQGATANDLLACSFFRAIHGHRQESKLPSDQWLRMLVPMSLRSKNDRLLPAANVVSSIFLDRIGDACEDADSLLRSIHDEMNIIKENRLGLTFVFSLMAASKLPGGLRKAARKEEIQISCVFTNLGRVLTGTRLPKKNGKVDFGHAKLTGVDVLAPIRPFGCVTLAANTYDGHLGLTLHYDARSVSETEAKEMMRQLVITTESNYETHEESESNHSKQAAN